MVMKLYPPTSCSLEVIFALIASLKKKALRTNQWDILDVLREDSIFPHQSTIISTADVASDAYCLANANGEGNSFVHNGKLIIELGNW